MTQKYLKNGGLIALITILAMIPPLATDLYMPGLPSMTAYFQTSSTLTTFTMTIFFIFMAIGILFLGAMSDRYGRKPILISSVITCILFSVACVFAPSIWALIFFRAIQAIGAGGMVAISTTIVKDSFEGPKMAKVLSITQICMVLAPMCAPILGGIILKYFEWQMTFATLAIITCISLIGSLLYQETLPKEKRLTGNPLKSILNIITIAKNKQFTTLMLVGGLIQAPFMAYLSCASFIYITYFALSEQTFSYYFATAAACSVIGPILYMRFGALNMQKAFIIGYIVALTSAILVLTIGHMHPLIFLLCYIPFPITTMFFRPMVTNLLLQTQKENVGAASSFLNFSYTVIGSIGMFIGSLKWSSYINGLGTTMLIFVTFSIALWFVTVRIKLSSTFKTN